MKFIGSLAVMAAAVSAVNLGSEAAVDAAVAAETAVQTTAAAETKAETQTAATATASAQDGYAGPIVPADYQHAVHDYDLQQPFTDQNCYQKQVDIYSDQIIAIEALRLEVLQLTKRISEAETDYKLNAQKILENKHKITENSHAALHNKAKIDVLELNV